MADFHGLSHILNHIHVLIWPYNGDMNATLLQTCGECADNILAVALDLTDIKLENCDHRHHGAHSRLNKFEEAVSEELDN